MSNREFFSTYCFREDLSAIYRYAMMDLASQFEGKPLWERSEIFEKWMNQPLNRQKWNEANDPNHRCFDT